ncbi:MAG: hypothetical protein ACYTGC_11600 [Planctomycetota bacterium]|jgi:hypothetical protein
MTTPIESSPPTGHGELAELPSKWPKPIGVFSLLYAIGGLTCASLGIGWMLVAPQLPEMWRGGSEIPRLIQITSLVQFAAGFGLGILMLVGAINVLRRRPSGPDLLRKWVVMRLALLLLGVVVLVLTSPAQIHMQRSVLEYRNRMFREADMDDRVVEKTDAQIWRTTLVQSGIFTGVLAIYPAFLGFFLSRRRVTEEVAHWSDLD